MTIGKERGSFEFAVTSYTAERAGPQLLRNIVRLGVRAR